MSHECFPWLIQACTCSIVFQRPVSRNNLICKQKNNETKQNKKQEKQGKKPQKSSANFVTPQMYFTTLKWRTPPPHFLTVIDMSDRNFLRFYKSYLSCIFPQL